MGSFKQYVIWRRKVDTTAGYWGLTKPDATPNPAIVAKTVIYDVFSDELVIAFDKRNGNERWRLPLNYLASHVRTHKGMLFGGTCQELHRIDPKNGNIIWTYSPYGLKGEHIYSVPNFARGHMYFGDRKGLLHCLNAASGKVIWKSQTGFGNNNQLNSSPLIRGNHIFVTNNCGRVSKVNAKTGKISWYVDTGVTSTAQPIIIGPRLFIHSFERLVSISLRAKQVVEAESHELSKCMVAVGSKGFIVALVKIPRDKNENVNLLKIFKGHSFKRAVRLPEFTFTIGLTDNPDIICVVHLSGHIFYSLGKNRIVHRITWPVVAQAIPSVPSFQNKKMYFVEHDGHIACLKWPLGRK